MTFQPILECEEEGEVARIDLKNTILVYHCKDSNDLLCLQLHTTGS
jgi:hypothetical protein